MAKTKSAPVVPGVLPEIVEEVWSKNFNMQRAVRALALEDLGQGDLDLPDSFERDLDQRVVENYRLRRYACRGMVDHRPHAVVDRYWEWSPKVWHDLHLRQWRQDLTTTSRHFQDASQKAWSLMKEQCSYL